MNDLIPSAIVKGSVNFGGQDIYAPDVDPAEIRFRIGMVFQRPNPFPKSIYENVAFGPRINGMTDDLDEVVETSLRRAAVWEGSAKRQWSERFGWTAAADLHSESACREP
jgi:phosphate transport system ATP-binding protein